MFPICFFIFCLNVPSVTVPDGAGGFVPYTNSRVMPDGSLRSYDPDIDGFPIDLAQSDTVYIGPPVIETPGGDTVLISPSGRPTDMVYPPRYYAPPSHEQPQPYQPPQVHKKRSHVRTMTEPEFDKHGKWVDPNPTPAPGSLCDPALEQC